MMNITRLLIPVVLSICLYGCQQDVPKDVYPLSFASPYPPGHPFSRADQRWMDHVSSASGGRIVFETFWSGALLSSDMSMLELRHGIADIGLITPIYSHGGAHVTRAHTGFYGGIEDISEQIALYKCLASRFDVLQNELHGLKILAVQGGNFPVVITRNKPVKTLEDFAGLRLRVQTEAVEVLKKLKADPVNMPMNEVYSALAKGVIDGVVAPADTLYSLHFSEVAEHLTFLKFSRGAYPARAMSQRAWQRLPDELQQVLADSQLFWEQALEDELLAANTKGIDFGNESGIQFHHVSPQEQQRFDQIYNDVALLEAGHLAEFDIDGNVIFETAQHIIATEHPIQCLPESTP